MAGNLMRPWNAAPVCVASVPAIDTQGRKPAG